MRRSLRFLLTAALAVQLSSSPVVGHEQGHAGDPSGLLWAKLAVFTLGAVCMAIGVYIDQNREERVASVDYLIIAGFLLTLAGGVSLYR